MFPKSNLPRVLLFIISLCCVLLVGYLDYLTGKEISFSIFYLFPIAFSAWYVGRFSGVIISIISAFLWLFADLATGTHYSNDIIPYWNAIMRLGVFLIVSLLISGLRNFSLYLEKKVEEKTLSLKEEIKERLKTEQILRESEKKYRDVVENAVEIIYTTDVKGNITYINVAGHIFTEYTLEELKNINAFELVLKEYRYKLFKIYYRQLVEKNPLTYVEFPFITKGGEMKWFGQNTSLIFEDDEVIGFHVVGRDITDRKNAENLLLKSEERYRRFFEDDLTGDFISTPEGKLLDCNNAFLRIFGFENKNAALDSDMSKLYPNQVNREIFLNFIKKEKKLEYYESELRRVDGKPIYVVENVFGEFDNDGKLVKLRGYIFDDTNRRQLEHQLRQAQKMEGLGTLAGGIAHDFNNILGIILGYTSLIKLSKDNQEKLSMSVDAISKAVVRGSGLVRQLLTFSRKTDIRVESVSINNLIRELAKLLEETFPKTITLYMQLDNKIPIINVDANQLHQALLNLSLNARDAMPNGGLLSFTTSVVQCESLEKRCTDIRFDKYVCVSVSDTGIGMNEATRTRIFEPFFTTKELGKGTGLGLSVVYGVVRSHEGLIDVESSVGFGTTFNLYLPILSRDIILSKESEEEQEVVSGGTETILVVEDEEQLLELLHSLLENKGYNIITARDGLEGLELFEKFQNDIKLVISDIGLPRLTGLEMIKHIKEINSDIKSILASGYLDPNIKIQIQEFGVNEFIQKPFDPVKILKIIREVLDK